MKPVRHAVGAAVTMLLAACSSVPLQSQPPQIAMPSAWSGQTPFHAGQPNDGALKGEWWLLFQDPQLSALERQAAAQNQSLKVAAARLLQARAQVTISSAALLPSVGLQAGGGRTRSSADRPLVAYGTPNQSVVQNNMQLGLAVSYEADLFGRVRDSAYAARASAEQVAADLENTRLVLMADVASGYFTLRERDAEIDVLRQSILLQQKAMEFIRARHDLGIASGLDVAQQQALLDSSQTQLALLKNQRAQLQHALATLVGEAAPDFALQQAVVDLRPPPIPAGVPSDLLQRRPDVASAERAVAVANANIGVARAAYFPSVNLGLAGGWDSSSVRNLFTAPSLLWSLGGAVTQTLFDAGRTDATVRVADAAYTIAVANYRQSVLVAMQDVEDGVEGLTTLSSAASQADAAVRSSQDALDLANERYTGGVATYLDVITAQQTLLNNQRIAVGIHGQQMTTTVFLIKSLGGGWDGTVQYAKH